MRDSQSLLEQLIAFGSKQIAVADVHRLLGTAGADRIGRLVKCLVQRDAAAALTEVDRAVTEGVDIGQLLDQLLGYFRDVMATSVGCPADALLHVSPAECSGVQESASQLGLETVLAVLQILDQSLSRIKYLSHPRIVAELALVRICRLDNLDALPQLISELRQAAGAELSPGAGPAVASKKKYEARPPGPEVASRSVDVLAQQYGDNQNAAIQSGNAISGNGHQNGRTLVEAGSESRPISPKEPRNRSNRPRGVPMPSQSGVKWPKSWGGWRRKKQFKPVLLQFVRQINWSSPSPRSIISANSSASGLKRLGRSQS